MADYKGIKGFNVQSLATDPLPAGVAGAAWSSGGSMSSTRAIFGDAGTQTAGLVFGGTAGSGHTNVTEEYNGTAWTSVSNMNLAKSDNAGDGSQTVALTFGGLSSDNSTNLAATEEYGINPATVIISGS